MTVAVPAGVAVAVRTGGRGIDVLLSLHLLGLGLRLPELRLSQLSLRLGLLQARVRLRLLKLSGGCLRRKAPSTRGQELRRVRVDGPSRNREASGRGETDQRCTPHQHRADRVGARLETAQFNPQVLQWQSCLVQHIDAALLRE